MERIPGVLNGSLARAIVQLGHGDLLVICDAGFSVPKNAELIDVSVTKGMPSFIDVLSVIFSHCIVEETYIAKEMQQSNPLVYEHVKRICGNVPMRTTSHEEFKRDATEARVIVRTGECTPFANIGLIGGVAFGNS
jgi:D-ribose pyranase